MKAKDIREMSEEELSHAHSETQRELFNLRVQKTTGQLENPLRLRYVRRDLARINTIRTERGRNQS